jgi:hypothetical protein
VAFYRLLLELTYRRQRSHFWVRFLKKLIPVLLLIYLIDVNSRHFREIVGQLNAWWGTAQTRMEMGAIAAALDAEFASTARYPETKDFEDFVRHWVRPMGTIAIPTTTGGASPSSCMSSIPTTRSCPAGPIASAGPPTTSAGWGARCRSSMSRGVLHP